MRHRNTDSKSQSSVFWQRCLTPVLVVLLIATGALALLTVKICLLKRRGPVCLSSSDQDDKWGPWGACDAVCGKGNRTRVRPEPTQSGAPVTEIGSCIVPGKCDETFHWQPWAQWTSCTKTCGPDGVQHRYRKCQTYAKAPPDVGKCPGGDGLRRDCVTQPPCPLRLRAHWTMWSAWTACTMPCGPDGTQERTRQCWTVSNEAVDVGNCLGRSSQTKSCNSEFTCIKSYNYWAKWSPWNSCSKTCGRGGTQTRFRRCQTNTKVMADNSECTGSHSDKQDCKFKFRCPSVWAAWGGWSECLPWTCFRSRSRLCLEESHRAPIEECHGGRAAMAEKEKCTNAFHTNCGVRRPGRR